MPPTRSVLSHGSWLDLEPGWIPPPEADAALETPRDELDWEQRAIVLFGRTVMQPRLIAWAGDLGYRYSGQTLEPRPLPPGVGALLARVRERTGVAFNHVLANRYRDGRDSMGSTPTASRSWATTPSWPRSRWAPRVVSC